jgi:hypothetical protein
MDNLFSTLPGMPNEEQKNDDNRLLKKLKIALVFWLVSQIITIIWFTNSPAF